MFTKLFDFFPNYTNYSEEQKFITLLNTQDYELMNIVSDFILISVEKRKQLATNKYGFII